MAVVASSRHPPVLPDEVPPQGFVYRLVFGRSIKER
jgi:hypothetical protein